MITIKRKQLDEAQISGYVVEIIDTNISGSLQNYINNSGYLGAHICYITGLNQTIKGIKSFVSSPQIPYSGSTGSAVSKQYLLDSINNFNTSLAVQFVHITGTENISGSKSFLSPVFIPTPTLTGHATTKTYVDTLTGTLGGYLDNKFISKSGDFQYTSGNLGISGNIVQTGNLNVVGTLSVSGNPVTTGVIFGSGAFGSFVHGAIVIQSSGLNVSGSVQLYNPKLTGVAGTVILTSGNNILVSGGGGGFTVTGGGVILNPNAIGAGTTKVVQSGTNILISGADSSAVTVSGSSYIVTPNFLSAGTTIVIRSGDNVLVSGAAGSSTTTVTGSSIINSPNFQGAGTTIVIRSGDNVLVSGRDASTLTVTGSNALSAPNLIGINSIKVIQSGANDALVSGADTTVTGSIPLGTHNFVGLYGVQVIQSGSNTIMISGSGIQNITNNTTNFSGDSAVSVTGSTQITGANFIGTNSIKVIHSGDNILVSGTLESSLTVSGSSLISAPNFIGAGATVVIQSGSNVLVSGMALTGRQTLWVPAGAMSTPLTSGASLRQVALGTDQPDLISYDFDTTNMEHTLFNVSMPKSWNKGPIFNQYMWTHATGITGSIMWRTQAFCVNDGEAISGTFAGGIQISDSGFTGNYLNVTQEAGPFTISGTYTDNNVVYFRASRVVVDPLDNLGGDARLIGLKVIYQTSGAVD